MQHQPSIPAMGVLGLRGDSSPFELTRHDPAPALRQLVLHYWVVRWELAPGLVFDQEVVPNPCVNLVVEEERSAIYGPASNKYTKRLSGRGVVFGVKFKPGGFYPYLRRPVAELTDRALLLEEVFDREAVAAFGEALAGSEEMAVRVEAADRLLLHTRPTVDPEVALVQQLVERIHADRAITRVEQLGQSAEINSRKLQRLFHRYVGVAPKWVIQLYRLQDAAERLEDGTCRDWTELALELGYYDQSHFIHDFRSIIGTTPEAYSRRFKRDAAELPASERLLVTEEPSMTERTTANKQTDA